mmetsp:Transcript_2493/g.4250  ORF Transcript_2493/g.4250 Transcript_2493/m.4250 type:complete len:170 (-) Transcript_2493:97-606(-)
MAQDMMATMFQQMATEIMTGDDPSQQMVMNAMMQGVQRAMMAKGLGKGCSGGLGGGFGQGCGGVWGKGVGGCKGKGKGKGKNKDIMKPGSMSDPNKDMKGKPGPNGEDPESGRWCYESKGTNAGKKWKWKKLRPPLTDEEKEAKRAKRELEGLLAQLEQSSDPASVTWE